MWCVSVEPLGQSPSGSCHLSQRSLPMRERQRSPPVWPPHDRRLRATSDEALRGYLHGAAIMRNAELRIENIGDQWIAEFCVHTAGHHDRPKTLAGRNVKAETLSSDDEWCERNQGDARRPCHQGLS